MAQEFSPDMRVVHNGTMHNLSASPASIVAVERHTGVGVFRLFLDPEHQRMEAFYWLAWHQLGRDGVAVGEFDDWLDGLEEFEMDPNGDVS